MWLLGAFFMALRIAWVQIRLASFARRQAPIDDRRLLGRVSSLGRRLGVGGRVRVLRAVGLPAPVAFGVLRPTIVLPVGFVDDFDQPEQDVMLVHELCHLAARDPAWQLLIDVVSCVLWWHPLVYWSRRRLRASGEAAADEASLAVPDGPDVLAGCLVTIGRRLARPARMGWLAFEGPGFRSSLGRRVQRLLRLPGRSWQPPGTRSQRAATAAVPVGLVLLTVFCTAWAQPQVPMHEGGTTMEVLKASWRRSLAAAAVAVFLTPVAGDTRADVGQLDQPQPAVEEGAFTAEGLLAFQDRERGEREEGDRERRDPEVRRDREHAERERGERDPEVRRDREHAEREHAEREHGEREHAERERGEREHAEGHDRPIPEELIHARRELEERARHLRHQLEGLRDDQDNEAREIHGALERIELEAREIEERIRAHHRPEGERHGPEADLHRRELMGHRAELLERAMSIRRELREHPEGPEARELHEALKDIEERVHDINEELEPRGRRPDRRHGEEEEHHRRELMEHRAELLEKAEAMRHELRELGDGHPDRAHQLHNELREIEERVHQINEELGPRDRPRPEGEELERRLEHLHAAVENLRAAGLHDQAERLIFEGEQAIRGRRGPPRESPFEVPPHARPPRERPRVVNPEVQQLRGQVDQMRREMEELRAMLRQVLERERE